MNILSDALRSFTISKRPDFVHYAVVEGHPTKEGLPNLQSGMVLFKTDVDVNQISIQFAQKLDLEIIWIRPAIEGVVFIPGTAKYRWSLYPSEAKSGTRLFVPRGFIYSEFEVVSCQVTGAFDMIIGSKTITQYGLLKRAWTFPAFWSTPPKVDEVAMTRAYGDCPDESSGIQFPASRSTPIESGFNQNEFFNTVRRVRNSPEDLSQETKVFQFSNRSHSYSLKKSPSLDSCTKSSTGIRRPTAFTSLEPENDDGPESKVGQNKNAGVEEWQGRERTPETDIDNKINLLEPPKQDNGDPDPPQGHDNHLVSRMNRHHEHATLEESQILDAELHNCRTLTDPPLSADLGGYCQSEETTSNSEETSSYTEDSISNIDNEDDDDDYPKDGVISKSGSGDPSGVTADRRNSEILQWLEQTELRSHGTGTQQSQTPQSSSSSVREQQVSSGTVKKAALDRKRAPGDDKDDDKQRKRRRKIDLDNALPHNQQLACPFPKHDPLAHTRCWHFVFRNTGDLKTHFTRYHLNPIHCARCGEVFETEAAFEAHQLEENRCEVKDLTGRWNGLNKDQKNKILGSRKARGQSNWEKWMEIYKTLFGLPIPAHPYHENFKVSSLRSVEETIVQGIPSFIASQDLSQIQSGDLNSLQDTVSSLIQDLIRRGFDHAIAHRRNIRPHHTTTGAPVINSAQETVAASSDSGLGSMPVTTTSETVSLMPIPENAEQTADVNQQPPEAFPSRNVNLASISENTEQRSLNPNANFQPPVAAPSVTIASSTALEDMDFTADYFNQDVSHSDSLGWDGGMETLD